MTTIGDVLRQAREEKGLTLQQIEEETNMRWKYLEALEQEKFDVIPGRAYIKGFLRNYAAFLGLDCDQIIDQYRQLYELSDEAKERIGENEVRRKQRKKTKQNKSGLILVAILSVVVIGYIFYSQLSGPKARTPNNVNPPEQSQTLPDTDKIQSEVENETENEGVPEAGEKTETNGASVVDIEKNQDIALELKATGGRSWVRVVVDDEEVFMGFISLNEIQTYQGKDKVFVRLGNAGAIEIKVNGSSVGRLGANGEVVNWEFTK